MNNSEALVFKYGNNNHELFKNICIGKKNAKTFILYQTKNQTRYLQTYFFVLFFKFSVYASNKRSYSVNKGRNFYIFKEWTNNI